MTQQRQVTEKDFRAAEFRDADPADYEFRDDGKLVRKDRWEQGMFEILGPVIDLLPDPNDIEIDHIVKAVNTNATVLFEVARLLDVSLESFKANPNVLEEAVRKLKARALPVTPAAPSLTPVALSPAAPSPKPQSAASRALPQPPLPPVIFPVQGAERINVTSEPFGQCLLTPVGPPVLWAAEDIHRIDYHEIAHGYSREQFEAAGYTLALLEARGYLTVLPF